MPLAGRRGTSSGRECCRRRCRISDSGTKTILARLIFFATRRQPGNMACVEDTVNPNSVTQHAKKPASHVPELVECALQMKPRCWVLEEACHGSMDVTTYARPPCPLQSWLKTHHWPTTTVLSPCPHRTCRPHQDTHSPADDTCTSRQCGYKRSQGV